jgi:UPF0271 protein
VHGTLYAGGGVSAPIGPGVASPPMTRAVDLNADLGESFGRWTLGDDAELVRHLTSANLACGFHAGDFSVMDRTVALCRKAGVAVGAQPGYPDLLGFGRRAMSFSADELRQLVLYQIGALHAFCRAHGVELQHVKPHGALYNGAAADPMIAAGIARGVAAFSRELPLLGLAGSTAFADAAADAAIPFVPEAFADRVYEADGRLRSRSHADALITDPAAAAAQAVAITRDCAVRATDGSTVRIDARSICCHGDTPGAVAIAAAVRSSLEAAGFRVAPVREHVAA